MKKGTFSKYFAVILFITVLTIVAIAGTYAKYTSNFSGNGSATAANWVVTVNAENPGTNVFTLTTSNKIYPGSTNVDLGNLVIANGSNTVKAEITSITVSVQGTQSSNLSIDKVYPSTITLNAGQSTTVPIKATWTYTNDDETTYNDQTITFNVSVTVNQVL